MGVALRQVAIFIGLLLIFSPGADAASYRSIVAADTEFKGQTVLLPDPKVTPGFVDLTDAPTLCRTRWGKDRRHVTERMRRAVFSAYGVSWERRAEYETDHLCSRELCGRADRTENLWPQPWRKPGAHEKDRVENWLHRQVCSGAVTPILSQRIIMGAEPGWNWWEAYRAMRGLRQWPPARQH